MISLRVQQCSFFSSHPSPPERPRKRSNPSSDRTSKHRISAPPCAPSALDLQRANVALTGALRERKLAVAAPSKLALPASYTLPPNVPAISVRSPLVQRSLLAFWSPASVKGATALDDLHYDALVTAASLQLCPLIVRASELATPSSPLPASAEPHTSSAASSAVPAVQPMQQSTGAHSADDADAHPARLLPLDDEHTHQHDHGDAVPAASSSPPPPAAATNDDDELGTTATAASEQPPSAPANQKRCWRASLGDTHLDGALGGGLLPALGITELYGAAGCGKSQFCMQAAIHALLPLSLGGIGGRVLYISTEGAFPMRRFEQLVEQRLPPELVPLIHSNLYVQQLDTKEAAVQFFESPTLLARIRLCNIRMIVLDSIAALLRHEFSGEEAAERSRWLWRLAVSMKSLAARCCLVMLVVNQVTGTAAGMTDAFLGGSGGGGAAPLYAADSVRPALGLAWSSCVSARLALSRTRQTVAPSAVVYERPRLGGGDGGGGSEAMASTGEGWSAPPPAKRQAAEAAPTAAAASLPANSTGTPLILRQLRVAFAPHLSSDTCVQFVIDGSGLHGLAAEQ